MRNTRVVGSFVLVVAALSLGLLSCGASEGDQASPRSTTTVAKTTTTTEAKTTTTLAEQDEGVELDEGETKELLAELVDVPGYYYEDIDDQERKDQLDSLKEMTDVATFHWVNTDDGDEVGWLSLAVPQPLDPVFVSGGEAELAKIILDSEQVTEIDMSGEKVFYADHPEADNGYRYQWAWIRHGTIGYADALERGPMETWLKKYFAQPYTGPEGAVLGSRVVEIPGYAYTDALDPEGASELAATLDVEDPSAHYVYDQESALGTLLLLGPAEAMSTDELASTLLAGAAEDPRSGVKDLGDRKVGDFTVRHLQVPTGAGTSDVELWQWSETPVVGVVVGTPGAKTARVDGFIDAYLKAQPSS